MKLWIPMGLLAAAAAVGGSSLALAQPRPPIPVHDDRKDPRRDPKDDHKGPDGRHDDHHDDHAAPPALPQAQPGDPRDHFIEREQRERERRREARKDIKAWEAGRQQRAIEARRDITATWGGLTSNAEAKAELAIHADRMARLNRVIDLATDRNEPTVVTRANTLVQREIARDSRVMLALKVKLGAR